jgi:hypothetical protein
MTTLSDKFASAATTAQDTGTEDDQTGLMFIGEGKQYATQEEADKAIAFKENHISTLEKENADLRAATQKSATLDEVLNRIQTQQTTESSQAQTETREEGQSVDIDALVANALDEKLNARESLAVQDANTQSVVDELTSRYGARAGDLYASKGAELGINLDTLAATSPKAVLAFFADPERQVSSYMASGQNTSNLARGTEPAGTYKYWNDQIKSGKMTREKAFQEQQRLICA